MLNLAHNVPAATIFKAGINSTAPDGEAQCNMTRDGKTNEICGGIGRLSVYSRGGPPAPQPVATVTTTAFPTPISISTGWTYKGCLVDNKNRILVYEEPSNADLTIESCISVCSDLGYGIAGVQCGVQCFCGNTIRYGGFQGGRM